MEELAQVFESPVSRLPHLLSVYTDPAALRTQSKHLYESGDVEYLSVCCPSAIPHRFGGHVWTIDEERSVVLFWGAQWIRFNEPPGGLDEASSKLLSRIQKMKENISRMQVFDA